MTRTENYRGTVKIVNGQIDPAYQATYDYALQEVKIRNAELSPEWRKERRFVVRRRYRGSRKTKTRNKQSMCLRKDAYAADVYIYLEWKGNR